MRKTDHMWQLVLWDRGLMHVLGYFRTKAEAEKWKKVLRKKIMSSKSDNKSDNLRLSFHDKTAGFEIHRWEFGLRDIVKRLYRIDDEEEEEDV